MFIIYLTSLITISIIMKTLGGVLMVKDILGPRAEPQGQEWQVEAEGQGPGHRLML